ncbi:MAG: hypothetical protein HY815_06460, partial [Candidatus Riflebacteria bacterium]|nr:hypothetical protein [Candidatus Riflebacteria bacterium]
MQPQIVTVGVYLQNVNDIDVKSSIFMLDFYIWFRWKGPIDPSASFEFTNVVERWGMTRETIYPAVVSLPDGSQYQCFHIQGKFNHKFDLREYPLDRQRLPIQVEDNQYQVDVMRYEADTASSRYDLNISIPGWQIDGEQAEAQKYVYRSTFGRPQAPGANETYSRFTYTLHISRPWWAYLFRMLVPLLVIIFSSLVVFFLSPMYADARTSIAITALLSAVALHLTVSTDLPQVGYIRLIDKIYNLAYAVIFVTLGESVVAIRMRDAGREQRTVIMDRITLITLAVITVVGLVYLIG